MAATTATLGVTSEYVFRGIDSSAGAAVQGSLDWSDGGFYLGSWASNTAGSTSSACVGFLVPGTALTDPVVSTCSGLPSGGTELDLYGGYKFKAMEDVEIDLGAIYYLFPENEEKGFPDTDYPEIYAGLNIGGFSGKLYYTNDFFNVEDFAGANDGDSVYVNLGYTFTLKEGLTLKAALGHQSGDGAEAFFGDDVTDYALTLAKTLDNGFGASFAIVGTDLDTPAFEDDPKVVVTLSKGFEI